MRLYQPGDRSAGICEICKKRVNTQMEYRDYTPAGWESAVPDVLVAVCGQCGHVVGVPHQSTPKINEHRKEKSSNRESIEARVPRVLEDLIELVTATLGGEPKTIRPAIYRYYLTRMPNDPEIVEAVKANSKKPVATQKANSRVSLKILSHQWTPAWEVARNAGIQSTGDLVRGIAVLIAQDFDVEFVDDAQPGERLKALKGSKVRRKDLEMFAKASL